MKKKSVTITISIIVAVIVAVTGVFVGVFFIAKKGPDEPARTETPPKITPEITPGGATSSPSERTEAAEPKRAEYDISFEKTEENYYAAELSKEQQSVLLSYAAGEFSASLTAENDRKEEITMKYFLEYDADGVNYSDGYSDTGKGDYNVGFIFSQNDSTEKSVVALAKTAATIKFSLTAARAKGGVSSVDEDGNVTYALTKENSTGTFTYKKVDENGEEKMKVEMLVWELSGSENLPKFVKDKETLGGKLNKDNVKWKYSEMPCCYNVYDDDTNISKTYDTYDEEVKNKKGKVIYIYHHVCRYRQYKLSGSTLEFNVVTYLYEEYEGDEVKPKYYVKNSRKKLTVSFIIYAPSPCTLVFNAA